MSAPDRLPADFFSRQQGGGGEAPDRLPANFFSGGGSSAREPEGFLMGAAHEIGGLASGAWNAIQPPQTTGEKAISAVTGPMGLVGKRLFVDPAISKGQSTVEAFKQGDTMKGALGAAATLNPLAPDVTKLYEQASEGDTAGAMGHGAVDIAALLAPEAYKGAKGWMAGKKAAALDTAKANVQAELDTARQATSTLDTFRHAVYQIHEALYPENLRGSQIAEDVSSIKDRVERAALNAMKEKGQPSKPLPDAVRKFLADEEGKPPVQQPSGILGPDGKPIPAAPQAPWNWNFGRIQRGATNMFNDFVRSAPEDVADRAAISAARNELLSTMRNHADSLGPDVGAQVSAANEAWGRLQHEMYGYRYNGAFIKGPLRELMTATTPSDFRAALKEPGAVESLQKFGNIHPEFWDMLQPFMSPESAALIGRPPAMSKVSTLRKAVGKGAGLGIGIAAGHPIMGYHLGGMVEQATRPMSAQPQVFYPGYNPNMQLPAPRVPE